MGIAEEKTLIRVDKNGTKYFHHRAACLKCGGTGIVKCYIPVNGGECFDCGGSGISEWDSKEYTPEHEAKLQADRERRFEKKKAEAMAKAGEKNAEFFKKNGFTDEGKTYFVLGDTYSIKDELKAQGAKWDNASRHWHMATPPEGMEVVEFDVSDIYAADYAGVYAWNSWIRAEWDDPEFYVNKIQAAEERLKADKSTSQHVGTVGEKISVPVVYKHTASWSNGYGGYWNEGVTNLHTFQDDQGNVYTWKTGNFINADYGTKMMLTGTIKEHGEYKGIKQTVMTRCKVQEVK